MKFELTPHQVHRAREFFDECVKHRGNCDFGATGGPLTYEFTPTSLGMNVCVVFCRRTADEARLDLTDYENW